MTDEPEQGPPAASEPAQVPGPGQTLARTLARMTWSVGSETYGLAVFAREPDLRRRGLAGGHAQVTFEPEGVSVLAPLTLLEPLVAADPEARLESDLAWIRFEACMGWELVGFLAHVCGHLARAGVPLGAVCSFDRDHLFVARAHLATARRALGELFPERAAT